MSKTQNHEQYYLHNETYSQFLNNQEQASFEKYTDFIISNSKINDLVLDVGCGPGVAIELILKKAERNCTGIEVSKSSVQICKNKKLNCKWYDGETFPFKDEIFDVVGSINVLEHTDKPTTFLDEKYRVLKKNGYIVLACPNFLSITNGYHQHTRGLNRKILNLLSLINKSASRSVRFDKMKPIVQAEFQPDDDAVNVTNSSDIIHWADSKKLNLIYWSSQQKYSQGIASALDKGPLRHLLGSCFFVFKKSH